MTLSPEESRRVLELVLKELGLTTLDDRWQVSLAGDVLVAFGQVRIPLVEMAKSEPAPAVFERVKVYHSAALLELAQQLEDAASALRQHVGPGVLASGQMPEQHPTPPVL